MNIIDIILIPAAIGTVTGAVGSLILRPLLRRLI